jgi:hypothetical protein
MKRLFTILFATMLAGQVWAQQFDYSFSMSGQQSNETLRFGITSKNPNTVAVIAPNNSHRQYYFGNGTLIIPKYVMYNSDTYEVTSIYNEAFKNAGNLKFITLPESVTEIGYRAFYNCSSLQTIDIPNSVVSIGNQAFYGCSDLRDLTLPESITNIGESAFMGCTNLKSITIPSAITSISDYTFSGCYNLTSATLPDSVTSIGCNAA